MSLDSFGFCCVLTSPSQQWLNKPDGNRGWASYMLEKGYEVYIIDQWSVGRSSATNLSATQQLILGGTAELAELAFTAPELHHKYYQAQFHTQWPGVSFLTFLSNFSATAIS